MFSEQLKDHITKYSTTPFLFIGSGFSRRYLNLPSWELLLKEMSKRLGLPKPYEYYRAGAENYLPKVASLMGQDFIELWWSDEKFELSREEYAKHALSQYSPIKYEICKRLRENSNVINDEILDKELRLLRKVNIDGIITTNWDDFIERQIFPDFKTYIGQEELIFSNLSNIGEIYKIHGSLDCPDSLVLTEEDYINYQSKNSYLASKLLTIFIENPIIFIGYSLSDKNIQDILMQIIKCISPNKIDTLKDRLIFCQWNEKSNEPSFTDSTIVISDTVIPIKLIALSNYIDLFTVLANNMRRIPIKILRNMKDIVYDFVKSTNPKQQIFIADSIDNIEDLHKADFVWGIGLRDKLAEHGIKGIELKDILRDVVMDDNANWSAVTVAKLGLPSMSTRGRFVPYFKYLRKACLLNDDNLIDTNSDIVEFSPKFITTVNSINRNHFLPPENYQKKKDDINDKFKSFASLKETCVQNDLHMMMYIPLLSPEKLSVEELGQYLKEKIDLLSNSQYGTHFRRLICLYDYMKYKEQK